MKMLISAALLLASCISALADRQADLVAAWSKQVHSAIKRTACYPQGTQDSGVVRTEFSVGRDGRVLVARVLESSGSGTLDEAALRPLQLPTSDTLYLATRGDEEKQHMSPGANVVKSKGGVR
jgi:TonB-like protein